jgi:hypothetical protein
MAPNQNRTIQAPAKAPRRQQATRLATPLTRVESPYLIPTSDKDFKFISDLFQRSTSIITGAECTAWGLLGGVSGYCVAHMFLLGLIGSGVGVPLGFIAAVAIYTLLNPIQRQLLKCLQRCDLTFESNLITKAEYEHMRQRCLETKR